MSTLVLSLLLIVLVAIGLVMGRRLKEAFDNPNPSQPQQVVVDVSPALANLLETPRLVAEMNKAPTPQVDTLKREREVAAAVEERHRCPKCPKCPDMSQYVRLDEVPCWNCTLP